MFFGLLALLGTALFTFGLFALKVLAVAALITGVVDWFKYLRNKFNLKPKTAPTIPARVLTDLIEDAKRNTDPTTRRKYNALEEALMAGCKNKNEDIIGMAQDSNGDIISANSFEAKDYSHQVEDARDYTLAVDCNGNILKKIRV